MRILSHIAGLILNYQIMTKTKFIDLSHDFGFKIVFANPDYPELLMRFLNEIIPDREIVSITYLNPEVLGPDEDGKRYVYDIKCTDENGNVFIVEMQKKSYNYFGDRLLAYSGIPLSKILKKGETYDAARLLYVVSVLGESLIVNDEDKEFRKSLVRRASVTMSDSGKVLSDKLNFIFLQLSAARSPMRADSFLEKFAWYIRTMSTYDEVPDEEQNEYFKRLFEASDRNNISEDKLSIYDRMVRDEIQIKAELDFAVEQAEAKGKAEGLAEGKAERNIEIAKAMKLAGEPVEKIVQYSGLSEEQVKAL